MFLLTQWFQATCSEGVSNIVGNAGAGWEVVPDLALGIDSAGTGARVDALISLAGFV